MEILNLLNQSESIVQQAGEFLPKLLAASFVFLLFYLLSRLTNRLFERFFKPDRGEFLIGNFARRAITAFFMLFSLVFIFPILGLNNMATALLASGGVGAIIIGFAFKDIGENLIAGVILSLSRPFEVKDLIASGSLEGIVHAIQLRNTHIRTADGRDIFIPNSKIFKEPLTNFTRDGLRRYSLTLGIGHDSETEAVRDLLLSTIRQVDGVLDRPHPFTETSELTAKGASIDCFYWLNAFIEQPPASDVKSRVLDACKKALAQNGHQLI